MKNYYKELIGLIIILMGIVVYICFQIDWNPPKAKKVLFVQIAGKTVPMHSVKIVQIPQQVYDSMQDNTRWANRLQGDTKRLLMLTWDGCPYRRAFHNQLDVAFGKSNYFSKYYVKDVEVTGQSVGGSCRGPLAKYCPLMWILDHCMGNICIINPVTHEAVVDASRNAKQILPLLMAYAQWTTEPLLEVNGRN